MEHAAQGMAQGNRLSLHTWQQRELDVTENSLWATMITRRLEDMAWQRCVHSDDNPVLLVLAHHV